MLQVTNETPFTAGLCLLQDPAGIDTVYVTVKATFALDGDAVSVAPEQAPLVPADRHLGDPGRSSVAHAGELHPSKPATDVALVGSGHAPDGRAAPYFGVSLTVGALHKVIHVFGDREWRGALGTSPSPPAPAVEVPLVYERAYGGRQDLDEGRFLVEPRNPVGVGFAGKRGGGALRGTPVPNLEHPGHPLRSPSDRPPPACFGFIAPSWEPRISYAGTYDEAWRAERAPYFPADLDPRFFHAVPPDQVYPGFLEGGEPVELINASPRGVQRFALPRCALAASVLVADRVEEPRLRIETLLLEPGRDRFSLLWRGAVPCDKQGLEVHEVALSLASLRGVAP